MPELQSLRALIAQANAAAPAPTFEGPRYPWMDRSQWDPRWLDQSEKGDGFLGMLQRPGGGVMSEYSRANAINGREVEYPLVVPTLSRDEVLTLLNIKDGEKVPDSIERKAYAFAVDRLRQGKSLFAGPGEQQLDIHPDLPRAGASYDSRPTAPLGAWLQQLLGGTATLGDVVRGAQGR